MGRYQQSEDGIFIIVRASTTKNHKSQPAIHAALVFRRVAEIKAKKGCRRYAGFGPGTIPSMWKFKQVLMRAGVAYKDDQGRQADVHALRRSFNTHLAQAAVDPQTRKEMMRTASCG